MPELLHNKLTFDQKLANVQAAIATGHPFLKKVNGYVDERISIVGYGPSLRHTWRDIPKYQNIIATSAAYDFLLERGVTPEIYVAIDPERHTVDLLQRPQKETLFLMASSLHPEFWNKLAGHDVFLWHLLDGEDSAFMSWVYANHPEGAGSFLAGGSTVGQRAMYVASCLGFRKFDVFGMDCSLSMDGSFHAGPHTAERQRRMSVEANGRQWLTTPQLYQSCMELQQFLNTVHVECTFHGTSLMSDIAREIQKRRNDHG